MSIVYIKGPADILGDIKDNLIVQLENEEIYTVNIMDSQHQCKTINLWNNSETVKNLQFENKYILETQEKTRVYTLKPGKLLILKFIDSNWVIESVLDEDNNIFLRYLMIKVELAIEKNKTKLDLNLSKIYDQLINQLNEDKNKCESEILKLLDNIENQCINKISSIRNFGELSKIIIEFNNILAQKIYDLTVFKFNESKEKLFKHIELMVNFSREDVDKKIREFLDDHYMFIYSYINEQINGIVSDKIRNNMIEMDGLIKIMIETKIKDDATIKMKADFINNSITKVEKHFKRNIVNDLISLERKFLPVVSNMEFKILKAVNDIESNVLYSNYQIIKDIYLTFKSFKELINLLFGFIINDIRELIDFLLKLNLNIDDVNESFKLVRKKANQIGLELTDIVS